MRWLQAGVVTWESVAAIVALCAGVALTVFGVGSVTTGMRQSVRVVVGSLVVLASALGVWTFTPAVIATKVPPTAATQIDLAADGREVHFNTRDGVSLWAWYVPPPDGKTVIVRHGSGSTASGVLAQAEVLVTNGYGVLMTDARGHGRSDGTAMDFGWYGEADIRAALDFLTDQPEVDPTRIGVLGMSMGGEEAIGAAGSDDRIAAVVAEGATARTDADKTWLIDEYGWRGWIQVRLEWLQYGLTDLLTGASKPPTLATLARLADPTPILMITGGARPDEGRAADHIQAASPGNVSVWTVPGAGHVGGLAGSPDQWEQTVIDFLDDALQQN
ncbi:MAG TPA: alpha/beta fold hydrolase [Acidimicrobiia bacterium]|nr:alpha/beta fold hydrolase [Acidimicrobiia bacterium]